MSDDIYSIVCGENMLTCVQCYLTSFRVAAAISIVSTGQSLAVSGSGIPAW